MSFTWFAERPLHSREEVMRTIATVVEELGMPDKRGACIIAGMTVSQEAGAKGEFWCPGNNADPCFKARPSDFPHDSMGDDSLSVGYYQQQTSKAGVTPAWGWGGLYGDPEGTRRRMNLVESTRLFLASLKRYPYTARNAIEANRWAQKVQGSGRPDAYAKHWDSVNELYNRVIEGNPANEEGGSVAVSGDPVWLEDVWRQALGDRLVVHEGWKERGAGGTMGVIWGTMIHHTGNDNERVEIIRDGVQQPGGFLPGPLSQALITRDGKLHLIAVGPCNHAGGGNWKTLTDGNRQSIGIECAYDGNPLEWPQAMVITMRDAAAAVSRKIGKRAADSVCGHKEYAKPQGRKPDPANMSMDWFRGEVQKDLDGFVFPGEGVVVPPPVKDPLPTSYQTPVNHTELMYDQINGRWEMLGWRTHTEALALILDAVLKVDNSGTKGFSRGPHDIIDKPRAE